MLSPARPHMPTTRDAILLHLRGGADAAHPSAVPAIYRLEDEGLVTYLAREVRLTEAGRVVADRLAYPEPVGSWGEVASS